MRRRIRTRFVLLAAVLVLAAASCSSDGVSESPDQLPSDDRCMVTTYQPPAADDPGRTLLDLRIGTAGAAVEFRLARNPRSLRDGLVCLKVARPGDPSTEVRINLPVSIEVSVNQRGAGSQAFGTNPAVTS